MCNTHYVCDLQVQHTLKIVKNGKNTYGCIRPKYLKTWQYPDCSSVVDSRIYVHTVYASHRVPYSIPSSSLLDPYVVMLSAGDCILYPQLLLCWTMRSLNHATTAILTHAVICQDGVPCQTHSQLVDDWILTDFGYAYTILSPITRIIRYYLQCPISSYLSSYILSYPILSYLSSYMILTL